MTGHPLFFLGGEVPLDNYVRGNKDRFPGVGLMLTYYTLRGGKKGRPNRRLTALIERKPYTPPKKGRKK